MEKYQQKMLYEYSELISKIKNLNGFITSSKNRKKISEDEIRLLEQQRDAMLEYSDILEKRIEFYKLGDELCDIVNSTSSDYNEGFIDRDIIVSKAYEDCLREMYRKSQPSGDYDEYVRKVKNGEIDRSAQVFNWHYLSREEYEYILEKYKDAYNIRSTWYDNVDIVKKYFDDGAIKDKWIPDRIDEDGFTHPGYRGYEELPDFKDKVLEILNNENVTATDFGSLSEKIKDAVIERIECCQNFYRFDREESGFECSIALGASPTSNKNAVKEYWKSQGVEIEFEDRNPDNFWEIDKYGYADDEEYEEYSDDCISEEADD